MGRSSLIRIPSSAMALVQAFRDQRPAATVRYTSYTNKKSPCSTTAMPTPERPERGCPLRAHHRPPVMYPTSSRALTPVISWKRRASRATACSSVACPEWSWARALRRPFSAKAASTEPQPSVCSPACRAPGLRPTASPAPTTTEPAPHARSQPSARCCHTKKSLEFVTNIPSRAGFDRLWSVRYIESGKKYCLLVLDSVECGCYNSSVPRWSQIVVWAACPIGILQQST